MVVMILQNCTINFVLNSDGNYTVFALPVFTRVMVCTHREMIQAINEYTKRGLVLQVIDR